MKLWNILSHAVRGWNAILRGHAGWREHFTLSTPGLVTAILIYALADFLAVAFASLSIGLPSLPGVIAAMIVLALPIVAFVVTLLGSRAMLKSNQPVLPLLVPGVYALTAFLLIEGLLALYGGPIVMLAWAGLAYLLFRLLRAATDWNSGIASSCAVFTVVLLVALRLALYMLSSSAGIAP